MSEWISVKDRLPEPEIRVLVAYGSEAEIAWIDKIKSDQKWEVDYHSCGCCASFVSRLVTHWMPLPELPEDK